MTLEQLLDELKNAGHTLGWGAVMAVSQREVNARLAEAFTSTETLLPAFAGRINLLASGSEFLEANDFSFGAPTVRLGQAGLLLVEVQLPLVAGEGLYRMIPGQSRSSGRLLEAQSFSAEAGYHVELTAEVKLTIDAFGNQAHVFLDLATATQASCNLSSYEEGNTRIAAAIQSHFAAQPLAFSQVPLLSIDLDVRDGFSVKDLRVVFATNPDNPGEGALLALMQLNDGRALGDMPGAAYPYLIPSDMGADNQPLYDVTWLLDSSLAPLLPKDTGKHQPSCVLQTSFPGERRFEETRREVPNDWAAFGKLAGTDAGLVISPANADLVAGETQRFSVLFGDGSPVPGVQWLAPQPITSGAPAGTISPAGDYTAAPLSSYLQDVSEIRLGARYTANGYTEVAYAVIKVRKAALMQQAPLQVISLWREEEVARQLQALALSDDDLHWSIVDAKPGERISAVAGSRRAVYTPPAEPPVAMAVRWVNVDNGTRAAQASPSNTAGLVLLGANHSLNVEPPFVGQTVSGQTYTFDVLEVKDGVLIAPDGQAHALAAEDNPWSVIGEGSITANGEYTPPASPTLPFDLVYYNIAGAFLGYAIVQTGRSAATATSWAEISTFSLRLDYGSRVLANGGQQLPVTVTIMTAAIDDPISGVPQHRPISAAELASIRLIDKASRQVLETLDPVEEGLAEQRAWATSASRNRYDLPQGGVALAEPAPQAAGDVERTRSRTLYLHTRAGQALEVAATFTANRTGVGERIDSDSASYAGPTSVVAIPVPVQVFTRATYRFPDGGNEDSTLSKPTYWRGKEYAGEGDQIEAWYSMSGDTSTGYTLSLATPGSTFVSMGLISKADPGAGYDAPLTPNVNQTRWESPYWGEGGVSYTAVALNSTKPLAGLPPSTFLGLGIPLRQLDTKLREAGLPVPSPASGPYPNPPTSVPLFDRRASAPAVGAMSVVLERRSDMTWKWGPDNPEEELKALQAATAIPVSLRLRDNLGNLHRLAVEFTPETQQSSGRNHLRLSYPGPVRAIQIEGKQNGAASNSAKGARAPASSLHSNAFNFLSFLEGGVDPRTGQYTLQLALPAVQANNLNGPELAIRLGFDPFTATDIGLGKGWSLNLSQVDTYGKGRLRLSSGEAYGLTALTSDGEYRLEERKLPVCRLFKDGSGYRLVHRDGTVETLEVPTAGGDIALPRTIQAPTGHRLHFTYVGHEGQARLHRVTDDSQRTLLSIEAGASTVAFEFSAEGQATPVTFKAHLNAGRLERLLLPTEEVSGWRLAYLDVNGYSCLSEVHTPVGGKETIAYDNAGHGVPGDARPRLPRVLSHTVTPGGGQPNQVVSYAWSNENFLGYGNVSQWQEEEDNLYRAAWNYTYWSVATHTDGAIQRTVKRTYNSLHLLAEEQTTQNGHVHTVTTDFHWQPGDPFSAQPATCQLPKKVTTQWRVNGTPSVRDEVVETDYDNEGNLSQHVAETGVVTRYTYYPGDRDSEGCPKDPYGFTRYEKTRTVTPASRFTEPGAPELTTTSTYLQCPALPGATAPGPVLKHTEALTEGASPIAASLQTYTWYTDASQALTIGRLAERASLLAGQDDAPTVERYAYTLGDGEAGSGTVLKTQVTLEGFDGTRQDRYLEQSTVTGLMLLERDTRGAGEDVDIRRRYDALQRVIEETVAPGTPQEASRLYSYTLVDQAVAGAQQTVTDVKGLRLRTTVDGQGRAIAEYRREPAASSEMQTFEAQYNGLGQLAQATEWDDFGAQRSTVAITEQYQYDDWGERCATLGADGVRRVEQTDPLGLPGEGVVQVRRQWLESADGSEASAIEVSHLNAFEQEVKRFRELPDDPSATHEYTYGYDGLGRKVVEQDPLNQRTTYAYDVFDRNVLTTLPDKAEVVREYAAHSTEDLPTRISVTQGGKEHLLGTQAFDGVGRMTEAVTGGRPRAFSYEGNQTRPTTVITPKQNTLRYEYQPRLGDQPILRGIGGADGLRAEAEERYEYDPQDARLLRCLHAQEEVMTRSYHSNGRLRSETRKHAEQTLLMEYAYSVGERLLGYTDVSGQQHTWRYDSTRGGRLAGMASQGLECTLAYDALGRDSEVTTRDVQAGTSLSTRLAYDAYGREIERCFDFDDGQRDTLAQTYDELDRITSKTLTAGDGSVLRHETFEYDNRGHLSIYECNGPECPQDPYGHTLTGQIFECDALDNHTVVLTLWSEQARHTALKEYRAGGRGKALAKVADDGMNYAEYFYKNALDPVQLTGITNTHDSYPSNVSLAYDADGNLLNDEWGRGFEYDELGRLVHVSALGDESPSTYHYDPLDVISARTEGAKGAGEGRFYCDGVLHTLLDGETATVIVRAGDHLLAEQTLNEQRSTGERQS